MLGGTTDPSVIDSLVVTTEDVVDAVEASDRGRRNAVLRVTPPFSARMRARLHVEGAEGAYDEPRPIHVDPRAFLADDVPRYPGRGADRWRSAVRDALQKDVVIDTGPRPHTVQVSYLG